MSDREQRFVDADLERKMRGQLRPSVALAMLYHGVSAIAGYFIYVGAWRDVVLPANTICFGLGLLAMTFFRDKPPGQLMCMRVGDIILMTALGAGCFFVRIDPTMPPHVIVAAEAMLLAISSFIVVSSVDGARYAAFRVAFFVLASMPLLFRPTGITLVDVWPFGIPVFILSSFFFRTQMRRSAVQAAKSEFARLSSFTPLAVIDRAMATSSDVATMFLPEKRFCVCLCSDWRSYQALTSKMEPEAVVRALEIYYTRTAELLKEAFPRGNYFSDWIADELFIVAFADLGTTEADVARSAVQFARDLLQAREGIAAMTGVPKAIDVGIAAGHASVGIMGPPGGRKATALGEIPGRSRRLQTAAKGLRQARGDRDRVVVGSEVFALCGVIEGLQTFAVDEGSVRDVADQTLYYLDAAA